MRTKLWITIIILGVWASVIPAQAVTRYLVPPGTPGVTPTAPYTDWATAGTNAFDMMQNYNVIQHGDVLIISNGVYELPSQCNPWGVGARYEGVTGNPDDVVFTPGPGFPSTAVLFYLNGGAGNYADDQTWVGLTFSGGVYRAVEDYSATNVTFSHCVFSDNRVNNQYGGALHSRGSGLKLLDCLFRNNAVTNSVAAGGGAVNCEKTSYAVISNCTFIGNWVDGNGPGGALHLKTESTTPNIVTGCVFSNNYVTGSGSSGGGAGYNTGPLHMQQCSFTSNSAASTIGGGWHLANTNTVIDDCVFENNVASVGGGVAFGNSGGVVSNCVIVNNSATSRGGGASFYSGYGGLLVGCVISNNTATAGGGVDTYPGGGGLRNCLITANTATNGGGIRINSVLTPADQYSNHVHSCTIAGNHASEEGGGILLQKGYIGLFDVWNSIIYANTATDAATQDMQTDGMVSPAPFYNSCTTSNFPSGNNISDDPLFIDAAGRNYRLATASPCISAGAMQDWMASALDLDGEPRIQGPGVDIGAYEFVPPPAGTVILIQ